MGLEPMTSPLPRECSTTELHQPVTTNNPYYSTATLTARAHPRQYNPKREEPQQQPRHLLHLAWLHRPPHQRGQQCQNHQRNNHPTVARRVHLHTEPSKKRQRKSGAQGRIRTSVTRRVADLQSAAINRSATCALVSAVATPIPHSPLSMQPTARSNPHGTSGFTKGRGTLRGWNFKQYIQLLLSPRRCFWSWRRDLNPRPPDYKSGALPAELRQP
jgi:hypothetical protein